MNYTLKVDIPTKTRLYCFPIDGFVKVINRIKHFDNPYEDWAGLVDLYYHASLDEGLTTVDILINPDDVDAFRQVFDCCGLSCVGLIKKDFGFNTSPYWIKRLSGT